MGKQIVLLTCMLALLFPLVLTGCCRVEVANLQDELNRTRAERDDLQAKLETTLRNPKQSGVEVLGLDGSLGEFQKQIDAFVSFREELQKREDELARLRQAALDEAKVAQERMNKLGTKLQAETERVLLLQGQLKQAQTAIVELQEKLVE